MVFALDVSSVNFVLNNVYSLYFFRVVLSMKMRKESKWIIEDTKQSNFHIEETNSNRVSGEEGEKSSSKRKRKSKWLEGGRSNDIEQESEPKKKKKHKTKKAKNMQAIQNSDGNKEKCIRYLKRWHEDRQNWKFEKLRQIWLFQNMLNPLKVPDSSFQILVDYISGSRGYARQMVVEKTMKVIKAVELWSKLSEEGLKEEDIAKQVPDEKVPEVVYERARSILQSLDDV
ncbi:hypothetical protein B7P43_G11631 [Cryptotermes secundus]|uniref:WKF domain-containing protein n=1 Tax=Cryptotermes secundus TaxID=105785 RepID=A0A2J7RGS0_9NEOP|nr:hypothetical protein B7P43_G11631 [Cryptotermes secundus]